ncbi:MAG: hypothetical protein RL180_1224, partial [Pseudomonadota bacterium]
EQGFVLFGVAGVTVFGRLKPCDPWTCCHRVYSVEKVQLRKFLRVNIQ